MKIKPVFFAFGLLIFFIFAILPTYVHAAATITFPNGGDCLDGNAVYAITWTLTSDHVGIAYRTDGGTPPTWQENPSAYFKHPTPKNQTTYNWDVSDEETGTVSTARIWVDAHASGHISEGLDDSDSDFSIDNSPPSAPTLSSPSNTNSSVNLSWTASTDAGCKGLTGYKIYRDSVEIASVTDTTYTDNDLTENTSYSYDVRAYDGFATTTSNTLAVTTGTPTPPPAGGGTTPTDNTAPLAITNLAISTADATSVTLSWNASGDDGSEGTASVYNMRYATEEITRFNWDFITKAIGEPVPKSTGLSESMTIPGLSPQTSYYFALNVLDEASNESAFSNVVSTTTLPLPPPSDIIAPQAIIDLELTSQSATSQEISWTAPGDDEGVGTAKSYDIRHSVTPLSEENWDDEVPFADIPSPKEAGSGESMTILGLDNDTTYYLAIKTLDDANNESLISNVIIFTTLPLPVPIPEPAPEEKIATTTIDVSITINGFSPSTVNIKEGDTVRWVNNDTLKRWVATAIHPSHTVYPDSDIAKCGTAEEKSTFDACHPIDPGSEYVFTFAHPGTWNYHDHLFPVDLGTVVVSSPPIEPTPTPATFSEGALITTTEDKKVYLIKDGKKIWIPTAEAFSELGYDWNDVQEISATDVATESSAQIIRIENAPEVYVIKGNIKLHIPSPEALINQGYAWDDIVVLPPAYGKAYSTANLIRYFGDVKVYFIENGLKHHIINPKIFNNSGYRWDDVIEVNQVELASYGEGDPLSS